MFGKNDILCNYLHIWLNGCYESSNDYLQFVSGRSHMLANKKRNWDRDIRKHHEYFGYLEKMTISDRKIFKTALCVSVALL